MLLKLIATTFTPEQVVPVHTGATHGALDVTPNVVHDHWLYPAIDWIFVAAIKPHNPMSWGYTHIVDGTASVFTEDKHNGAHVIPVFPILVTIMLWKWVIRHKLFGSIPMNIE